MLLKYKFSRSIVLYGFAVPTCQSSRRNNLFSDYSDMTVTFRHLCIFSRKGSGTIEQFIIPRRFHCVHFNYCVKDIKAATDLCHV